GRSHGAASEPDHGGGGEPDEARLRRDRRTPQHHRQRPVRGALPGPRRRHSRRAPRHLLLTDRFRLEPEAHNPRANRQVPAGGEEVPLMLRVRTLYACSAGETARYYTRYLDEPDEEPGRWR